MEAGQEFGSYRLLARIGAGGMGEVWKAEDPRLRRTVAIKILPADSATDAESNARFLREARTAAQLYHPNIATIHSIEEHEGRAFIVMEYVEGEPLSRAIRSGGLGEEEVAVIGRGVAEALAEAHARGIVHRDVKPDNVILTGQRVKVLDFGIAKRVEFDSGVSDDGPTFAADFRTQKGIILGTIQYMSPEQAMGKPIDGRSDIFSLGVVLYEAATGGLPFRGETITDTLTRIIRDEAPDLRISHPRLSSALSDAIMRCLAKEREKRFQNAGEVAAALDAILAGSATARKAAREDDLPTAVSVRPDERNSGVTRDAPAPRAPETAAHGNRGVWPWIFATLLLVVFSVAGTAWYLTSVLRPQRDSAVTEPPGAGVRPLEEGENPASTRTFETGASPEPAAVATGHAPPEGGPSGDASSGRESLSAPEPFAAFSDEGAPAAQPVPGAPPFEQAEAWARRGHWLLSRGEESEGVAALKRAVEIDPSMARAWMPIGVAALRRGRADDAAKAFRAVLAREDQIPPREAMAATFGLAIASGDHDRMSEICRTVPHDREFGELRRLARAAGAECAAPEQEPASPRRNPVRPDGSPRP